MPKIPINPNISKPTKVEPNPDHFLDAAVIGLSTMGGAFAKNLANKGYQIGVFNRSIDKTKNLDAENIKGIYAYYDIQRLINNLKKPAKIFLLVQSGPAVDQIISQMYPFLMKSDIIIDCGNSFWQDTWRRQQILESGSWPIYNQGETAKMASLKLDPNHQSLGLNNPVYLVGCGLSGGEYGALNGPSLMPGGEKTATNIIVDFLASCAAKDFDSNNCIQNMGYGPSGHFVKMVHNGIEYAMMQGIAEIYDILKSFNFDERLMVAAFEKINKNETSSYLLDITIKILKVRSVRGINLLDELSDKAGSKGTGKWTCQAALDLGVYAPNIFASLQSRVASARDSKILEYFKSENLQTTDFNLDSKNTEIPPSEKIQGLVKNLQILLKYIYITSLIQGLEIIIAADKEYLWKIPISEVIRIWQGGCIIQTKSLLELDVKDDQIRSATLKNQKEFWQAYWWLFENMQITRPISLINSTADYLATLSSKNLPTNLIQAQRDYFGSHGYQLKTGELETGGFIEN